METIVKKIIDQLRKAKTKDQLSEYLAKTAEHLQPQTYEDETLPLDECIELSLADRNHNFSLNLGGGFEKLTSFFWITPGLHVIAAPSSHGKTFYAMKWAIRAAEENIKVLFLSLEMTPSSLGSRTLSTLSGFPLLQLIKREYSDLQKELLRNVSQQNPHLKNIIVDKFGSLDWNKIYPRLSSHMTRHKPKVLIIDYLQMLHDSEDHDGRQSQLYANIARELKLFADKTDSAVILLSQINREGLKQIKMAKWSDYGFVPMSSDFVKESGGIVEAADSVQLICIPERFFTCPPEFKNKFQVGIEKSRTLGQLGVCLFDFDADNMRFT